MAHSITIANEDLYAAQEALRFFDRTQRTREDPSEVPHIPVLIGLTIAEIVDVARKRCAMIDRQMAGLYERYGARNAQDLLVPELRPRPVARGVTPPGDSECAHVPHMVTNEKQDGSSPLWTCRCGAELVATPKTLQLTDRPRFLAEQKELLDGTSELDVPAFTLEELRRLPDLPIAVLGALRRFVTPPADARPEVKRRARTAR